MPKFKSMYRGKVSFTQEQLIFAVDAAISAAIDRIDSGLPTSGLANGERIAAMRLNNASDLSSWDNSALETCGMFLGILYAQLTEDGLGIGDAIDFKPKGQKFSIRSLAENYVEQTVKKEKGILSGKCKGIKYDSRSLAEAWVKEMFKDYLNDNTRIKTYFIIVPIHGEDKIHHVAYTDIPVRKGTSYAMSDLNDIYNDDDYTVLVSYDNMKDALDKCNKLGVRKPHCI